jgi:2-haloacid dehalogenase
MQKVPPKPERAAMKHICVFDVNETLLDLKALDPHFERVFGDAAVRGQWFGQFIQSALVTIVTDSYVPFGTVGAAAFDMIAERRGIAVAAEDKQTIMQAVTTLPPRPEVEEALARLKAAGFTTAALTNSTHAVVEKQLTNAGLAKYFDKMLSADAVKSLKPSKAPYEMAAQSFGVEPSGVRLIAAHAWDIAGALHAGCAAAFIARPGMVLDPLVEKPDIVGRDLTEVVEKIIDTASAQ